MKEKAMRTISAGGETARSPRDVKHSNRGFISFLVGDKNINGSARLSNEFLWNFGLAPTPSTLQPPLPLTLISPVTPLPSLYLFSVPTGAS